MSQKRAGGSSKNLRDSKPKYLGVKCSDGATVATGHVLVRQRGTRIMPGKNVRVGRDHTLYAVREGVAKYRQVRKRRFDGKIITRSTVEIVPTA